MISPENRYFRQASLLLRCIPSIARERCFALKGGTAINFFVRDLPRLSVDIDLTYLPIEDRQTSLKNEGITGSIRHAFIVYLISHNRPMNELLNPRFSDITETFNDDFSGMTTEAVSLDELLSTREKCLKGIHSNLTDTERRFILSIKEGEPQWELSPLPHIKNLPSVQWKLMNIKKMNKQKHKKQYKALKEVLGM